MGRYLNRLGVALSEAATAEVVEACAAARQPHTLPMAATRDTSATDVYTSRFVCRVSRVSVCQCAREQYKAAQELEWPWVRSIFCFNKINKCLLQYSTRYSIRIVGG